MATGSGPQVAQGGGRTAAFRGQVGKGAMRIHGQRFAGQHLPPPSAGLVPTAAIHGQHPKHTAAGHRPAGKNGSPTKGPAGLGITPTRATRVASMRLRDFAACRLTTGSGSSGAAMTYRSLPDGEGLQPPPKVPAG